MSGSPYWGVLGYSTIPGTSGLDELADVFAKDKQPGSRERKLQQQVVDSQDWKNLLPRSPAGSMHTVTSVFSMKSSSHKGPKGVKKGNDDCPWC